MSHTHSSAALRTAFLFPGQGGFDGEALRRAAARHPQIGRVFARLDQVTQELYARRITDIVFGEGKASLQELLDDDPWVSQIAIYGAGLAAYEILTAHGVRADVLTGHSLGEITALVAAGAFSAEDGARIVAHRVDVIERHSDTDGRMVALTAGAHRSRQIIDLIDNLLLAVATENHDEQTVVSGPTGLLDKVVAIAGQLGVNAIEIDTPFPFHTPALAPAAPAFAEYVRQLDQHPLTRPVYSPILERYYEPGDILADLLAEHFTQPVRFAAAVRYLHEAGVTTYLEVGGRSALSKLVGHVIGGPATGSGVLALPSLALSGNGGALALDRALDLLHEAGLAAGTVPGGGLADLLAPQVDTEVFAGFWSERGPAILDLVRTELAAYQKAWALQQADDPVAPVATRRAAQPPEPVDTEPAPTAAYDRDRLFGELRSLYAEALEYPEDVFEDEVQLEAELGVDSVKQVELLSRISERYGLPPRESGFRLASYNTMGKVTDFVLAQLNSQGTRESIPAAG